MRSASPLVTGLGGVPSQSCPGDGTQDYYHRSTDLGGQHTLASGHTSSFAGTCLVHLCPAVAGLQRWGQAAAPETGRLAQPTGLTIRPLRRASQRRPALGYAWTSPARCLSDLAPLQAQVSPDPPCCRPSKPRSGLR